MSSQLLVCLCLRRCKETSVFVFASDDVKKSQFLSLPPTMLRNLSFCLCLRRCKETSVFAVVHFYIVPFFFCISVMSLFTEFPAFTMFVIFCHALFLPPEVIDEENFPKCFQNNFSLLVLLQKYNFFSICPIWLPFRHFFYFQQSRIVTFKHTRP